MTLKEEVLSVLPEAYPEETQHLLEILGCDDVEEMRDPAPAPALVMMDVRDCFGVRFHLGEVLVTTAGVRGDGRSGHGAILRDEPAKALLLACLDLLDPAGQVAARERLAPHLDRLARRAEAALGQEARMAGSTRVDFRSMAAE